MLSEFFAKGFLGPPFQLFWVHHLVAMAVILGIKPDIASLLDVLPPWPWYIPVLLLLAVLFLGIAYLPIAIKDFRSRAA